MKTSSNDGFTLMELIVVVTIIALLASLLMPAISMVRQSAKTLQCAANLRQVFVGFTSYAADQDGMVVAVIGNTTASSTTYLSYMWFQRLAPYLEARKDVSDDVNITTGYGNLRKQSTVLYCPSARNLNSWDIGYGMNWQLRNPEVQPGTGWKYSNILDWPEGSANGSMVGARTDFYRFSLNQPASRGLIDDSSAWHYDLNGDQTSSAPRHRGLTNVLFCDGHVQAVTPARLKYTQTDPGKF